jgi:hypothetical protein
MVIRLGILALIVCLLALPVAAIPPLPNEFSGTVTINGKPAPAGTVIVAQINGIERGRVKTTAAGVFGGPGAFDKRLVVSATEEDLEGGEPLRITFWALGSEAATTATFAAGEATVLSLDFQSPTGLEIFSVPVSPGTIPQTSVGTIKSAPPPKVPSTGTQPTPVSPFPGAITFGIAGTGWSFLRGKRRCNR